MIRPLGRAIIRIRQVGEFCDAYQKTLDVPRNSRDSKENLREMGCGLLFFGAWFRALFAAHTKWWNWEGLVWAAWTVAAWGAGFRRRR